MLRQLKPQFRQMYQTQKPDNRTFLGEVPNGRAGVKETLKIMSTIVKKFARDPQIRNLAISITSNLDNKDFSGEVREIFNYVQTNIRYVGDVLDVETLQTPDVTLANQAGDCDDMAMLIAALLESINHPTRFRAVGFAPGELSHVYVETLLGTTWVPLDATEPYDAGWQPPEGSITDWMYWHN